MKQIFAALLVLVGAGAAFGQYSYQSSRIGENAEQLKRDTGILSERVSQDILRNFNVGRNDLETAILAKQIDGTAMLFLDMVRARKPVNQLREAASLLTDMTRRAPNVSPHIGIWRTVQNVVNDINRDLSTWGTGGGSGGSGGGSIWNPAPPNERPIIGRVSWRGRVDDRVHLTVQGSYIESKAISGTQYGVGNYNFTSPLPNRNVEVAVEKREGRGRVSVIQQPSRANSYTAVIEIVDSGSGARDYELDIVWR
jgi:hypothetical protein